MKKHRLHRLNSKVTLIFLAAVFCLLVASYSFAAVPHLINYQGRLTNSSGAPLEGSYSLTFRIYDAETAGNLLWEETQNNVVIQKGIFSVLLGSVTNLDLTFDKPYFLEIKVGEEVMSPRQRISSAGYAVRAEQSERIFASSQDTLAGYLSDKVDSSSLEVNASNKLQVKNSGITSSKISAVLGSSTSKSFNIVYQAASDGFVVAYSERFGGWGAIYGYADSSNPPTAKIADNNGRADEEAQNVFICFPVKKGNYWKVSLGGNASPASITWVPLGN